MLSKQATNHQQEQKLTPTFESTDRSSHLTIHGPRIMNESYFTQREQLEQTPEPQLTFTEEVLLAL